MPHGSKVPPIQTCPSGTGKRSASGFGGLSDAPDKMLDEIVTIDTATSPFRFAIAATFTAEPLRPVISFWARPLNAQFDIRFAPYNQITQTILDPGSELGSNTHGVNVVLARLEDLGQFEQRTGSHWPVSRRTLRVNWSGRCERRLRPSRLPLIFCWCPSSPAFLETPERQAFKKRMTAFISAALDDTPGVQFLHYEQVDRLYPVESPHDPEGERLGKIPYTELYYCALGTALVRSRPCAVHASVQGGRARLRQHAMERASAARTDCEGVVLDRAAARAAGVHGGAARGRHAAHDGEQEQ